MNTTELRKEMEKAYPAIFLKHGFEKVRTEFSSNINGNIIKGYKYEKNTSQIYVFLSLLDFQGTIFLIQ